MLICFYASTLQRFDATFRASRRSLCLRNAEIASRPSGNLLRENGSSAQIFSRLFSRRFNKVPVPAHEEGRASRAAPASLSLVQVVPGSSRNPLPGRHRHLLPVVPFGCRRLLPTHPATCRAAPSPPTPVLLPPNPSLRKFTHPGSSPWSQVHPLAISAVTIPEVNQDNSQDIPTVPFYHQARQRQADIPAARIQFSLVTLKDQHNHQHRQSQALTLTARIQYSLVTPKDQHSHQLRQPQALILAVRTQFSLVTLMDQHNHHLR